MNALFFWAPLMLLWLLTFVPRRRPLGATRGTLPLSGAAKPPRVAPSGGLGETAVTGVERPSSGSDSPSGAAVTARRLAEPERPLTKALTAARSHRHYGNCVYCGAPCYGLTCRAHSDLPRLEPYRLATNHAPKEATDG